MKEKTFIFLLIIASQYHLKSTYKLKIKMLDYTNSAFSQLMLSVLGLCLGLLIVSILYRITATFASNIRVSRKRKELAGTKAEEEKTVNINTVRKTVCTTGFLVNLLMTIAFAVVSIYLGMLVSDSHKIAPFDPRQLFNPYQILEIDDGCDDIKIIQKAYRKLSLKYHPDKDSPQLEMNQKQKEMKFMKVAKAYEILTDEASMESWKKYGIPDADEAMREKDMRDRLYAHLNKDTRVIYENKLMNFLFGEMKFKGWMICLVAFLYALFIILGWMKNK
mmetsp:Transcript_12212/g.15832  ORF Transcript_12212/g.15832 Transcript_12212/m.15832 type:complete len:277 (-) Transcript_12212:78-908(-)